MTLLRTKRIVLAVALVVGAFMVGNSVVGQHYQNNYAELVGLQLAAANQMDQTAQTLLQAGKEPTGDSRAHVEAMAVESRRLFTRLRWRNYEVRRSLGDLIHSPFNCFLVINRQKILESLYSVDQQVLEMESRLRELEGQAEARAH